MKALIPVLEQGIFENEAFPVEGGRWAVEGLVDHRPVRIVYCERFPGEFTIITAMWCHSASRRVPIGPRTADD